MSKPFKMTHSRGAFPFKSPLKQVNSNSWLTEHGKNLLAKKTDFNFLVEKSQQGTNLMPKNFNMRGDPSSTPWDWTSNMDNARNITENYRSSTQTPSRGYLQPSKWRNMINKNPIFSNLSSGVKQVANIGSKLGRFANFAAPPLALYDFWKTGRDRGTLNTSRIGQETLNKMRSYGTNKGFNFTGK